MRLVPRVSAARSCGHGQRSVSWGPERPKVTDDPVRALAKFAAGQWGVVSRAELIALGLSPKQVKGLAARGHLHLLHRGVYAVGHRNVTTEGRFLAAVKACGEFSMLSHYAGACQH